MSNATTIFEIHFTSQIEAKLSVRAKHADYKLAILRTLWNCQLAHAHRNGFDFLCDDIDIVSVKEVPHD